MAEEEENLGKAMRKLTPLQRAWVYALVETGGNPTEAAHKAGYGADAPDKATANNRAKQAGFQNARNPKVQDAIREEAGHRIYSGALIGASVLIEIASDPNHKDRLKAANRLMEHNGYQIISKSEIDITHRNDGDTQALTARIVEMATRLGLDANVLLGRSAPLSLPAPVDAEFAPLHTPAPTAEGLEDLL